MIPRSILLFLLTAAAARAGVTPMDESLKEDGVTVITVKYDGANIKYGKFNFKATAGEYHYNLYLPPDYNKDPKEIYPLLFMQSPSGNAGLGAFKSRVKSGRYVVAGLVEARNGEWDPILANFCAAHDDVLKRVRIAEGFKYMAGMSGGGRSSTFMPDLRPGFGGCFPQGAGVWPNYNEVPHNPNIGMFLSMGNTDGNARELPGLHKLLPPNVGFCPVYFEGGHTSAPAEVVEQGFDWLEWWSYYGSPTQAAAKPMYTQQFNKLTAQAASGEFEKYELLDKAEKLANVRSLGKDKEIATKLTAMKKAIADLAKAEAVKKELPARTAYQKIADAELAARRQSKGDFSAHKRLMAEASAAYEGVAKKYPGTIYAEKATAAAARTKTESELPHSTK